MNKQQVEDFVRKAEELYAKKIRPLLEPDHNNEFVVIEPESGDFFLGKTLSEAGVAARSIYPNRLTHAMRIGHAAAIHFGMHVR